MSTTTNFLNRARWVTKYGVPVVPGYRYEKFSRLSNWPELATTGAAQLELWNNDDDGYNVIAVAKRGVVCIIDIDDPAVLGKLPQPLPPTLKVATPSGGQHIYFLATKASDALGNRNVMRVGDYVMPDEQGNLTPLLELKVHNVSVAAPGSWNAEGISYKPIDRSPLCDIPAWLVEWVAEHAETTRYTTGSSTTYRRIHSDFGPADFFEYYERLGAFAVRNPIEKGDADLYVPQNGCIFKGDFHTQSTLTGFMVWKKQDEVVGFSYSCFAASCPGHEASISDLMEFLEEEGYPEYPYYIYEDEDDDFADPRFPIDRLDDDEQQSSEAAENSPQPQPSVEQQEPASELPDTTDVPAKPSIKRVVSSVTDVDGDTFSLVTMCAGDMQMTSLKWLWPNRIPSGKITLYTGKPDCGKTMALLDLVARVSTGRDFPDGQTNSMGARQVLVAASEDDPADTLIPRLKAAGADLKNVQIIWGTLREFGEENPRNITKRAKARSTLNLKRDANILLRAVKAYPEIALLVLDPITSFFGDADQNRDKDIRPVMDAIAHLCQKSGITVVGLIHSNKRSDVDAVQKVLGASSVAGSARAVWGFSRDPEDKTKYRMALVKGNLARKRSGMAYTIAEEKIEIEGESVGVPRIVWGDEIEDDANDLLLQERERVKELRGEGKIDLGVALLTSTLPARARDIFAKAEKENVSEKTLRRAKSTLGVEAVQRGNAWWWYMPGTKPVVPPFEEPVIPDDVANAV